ncbi:MAG: ABC transporter ATP-binding protein [Hyphomicrobiaceae bacterium]
MMQRPAPEPPALPPPPVIEGRALETYYGQSHILRGVSLAIRPGESVGLMGRNGMGKSTFIRTLMGLVPATRGEILVDGQAATRWPTFAIARAGIAYVPEGRGIFSSLTVADNLAIAERRVAGSTTGWDTARVLALFPRLGERLANRGDQLSGGEQQMLAIARALVGNPRLVILDEATEGLAPLIRDEIWKTIRLIRDAGIATLIVDKTVGEVAAVVDRVVILVKGQIVVEGAADAILSDTALMQRHLGV